MGGKAPDTSVHRSIPGPVLVGALVLITAMTACRRDGDERSRPLRNGPASTTVDSVARPTKSQTATTGQTATTATTRTPATTQPRLGRPTALSFADFYRVRKELIGTTVKVRGRALFVLRCPPPGQTAVPSCTAIAFLADESTRELVPYEQADAVQLFRSGRGVGCASQTATGLECQGFRHGEAYEVTATPTEAFGSVVLEVATNNRV